MTPSDDPASPGALCNGIGRTETRCDAFTAAPLAGLSALLDRACDPASQPGPPLPPLAHWLYFLPQAAQREKGMQRIFSLCAFVSSWR